MFKVTVKTNNTEKSGFYSEPVLISQVMEDLGIYQPKPCGGSGTCGKCKAEVNGKEVLSCRTYADSDTYVYYNTHPGEIQGLTEGAESENSAHPLTDSGFAMAVDIGTTTVAAYIYEFPGGKAVCKRAVANRQAQYGADVISRIECSNEGGLKKLSISIRNQIKELAGEYNIEKYVITGNTTMLHLLTATDPRSIAVAPFEPESLFGGWYENAYLPRCISAYVGADTVTAILSSKMMESSTSFLVDIGTNGEMALWHSGKLICCSTAAGPVFEGAGITHGMLATDGAIDKVSIEDGKITYTTIGGKAPEGICGSGLIDAVACMLKLEIIDETGYLEEDFEIGNSGIFITSSDIRNLQLAKSAIRSGIDTLLNHCSIDCESIEKFYIAGGFGSFINKESAAIIGLIPYSITNRITCIGNAAGSGAAMLLKNQNLIEESEIIAKNAHTVELSSSPYFMDKYIENMMFEVTQ